MIIASQVTMVEMAPAIARLPVEKMAPISGVSRVVPQVGQPAPRAISPVMMPAFSRLAEFWSFFFFHKRTIRPIRMPCKTEIAKIGSQSRNGWLKPKIPRRLSPMILRLPGRPTADISSNLAVPPESKFIRRPKNKKAGTKPYQKRFSLVASKMPLPAKTNSSHHFLQFIHPIITYAILYFVRKL